jgi:3-oxoacyl-[acyl-carrier protein] reductase
MTDTILELSQNPIARNLISRAKLPIPMPERLERLGGPMPERPLEDKRVLIAAAGGHPSKVSSVLARVLTKAGAMPLVSSEVLRDAFAGPSEAYGRATKLLGPDEAETTEALHAIVLDATSVASSADLKLLYEVFHTYLRPLGTHGRAVVIGRPVDTARNVGQAAARAGLEGFTRSLAKEVGGKAITANLIYVDEGADERLGAPLRFFLSKASAFVTAQPLRVTARVAWEGDDPFPQPLAGKVALVTGAARGIGEATARTLAGEGAHVVCLDRPEDDAALSAVASSISGSTLLCDVMSNEAPRRIAQYLIETHGGVDIVVHNAGITRDRTLARMDEQRWDTVLGINLQAILRITETLLDGALHDGGRIISLSSIGGIAGNMGQTNYGASKAGVIGLTKFLAGQLASRGITVNAVAPGFIETRMTAAMPVVVREVGRRLAALGQGGQPEDVAQAITFFASPGAAGLTGNVLRVCGGALIGA